MNLSVRNENLLTVKIISEIPKMDEKCQDILAASKCNHIIAESPDIDLDPAAGNQFSAFILSCNWAFVIDFRTLALLSAAVK